LPTTVEVAGELECAGFPAYRLRVTAPPDVPAGPEAPQELADGLSGALPGALAGALSPASSPAPDRPPGVPLTASWVDADGEWRQSETDEAGLFHGPFRSWRVDGSLKSIATHDHGKQVGTSWRFHPDGSLFSLGHFVNGFPRGVHRRYASVLPTGERLQSCCVPTGAWQLRQTFAPSGIVDRGWFNHDGARLLDNGELYPDRPAAVPPEAWFNEDCRSWEMGVVYDQTGYTGTRKRWSVDGTLRLVEGLLRGKRHGSVQTYSDVGTLAWEATYDNDRLSGTFRALEFSPGHFADPAVCRQEGWFAADQAEGVWLELDGAGEVRTRRDLGLALAADSLPLSPVLANEGRSPAAWRALAESLAGARRLGEALLAAARATAAAGDPAIVGNLLEAKTIRLGAQAARAYADEVLKRAAEQTVPMQLCTLIDALKRGGDAPTLLWAVARALQGPDRAALDFVTAALLLAPDQTAPLSTRALLYGSLGDLDAARADVARLSVDSPEQAKLLELVTRAYFPRFDFWPARESLDIGPDEPALQPRRTPEEVRELIQRYATRIGRIREALCARVPASVPFMLPDLSALLPDGPVPIRQWTFTMSAEEYGGSDGADGPDGTAGTEETDGADGADPHQATQETAKDSSSDLESVSGEPPAPIEIVVDETQGLPLGDTTLLTILRQARADWSGLTWLCWAAGLDAPGLPDAMVPPRSFGRVAVMTMERTWRCRDKLRTAGLLALTKGIPGFDWEGTPIDLVPSTLVEVALDQYLEARAVFSWLCDPANRSPWQDDLRGDG
jgi:hypothetical protein